LHAYQEELWQGSLSPPEILRETAQQLRTSYGSYGSCGSYGSYGSYALQTFVAGYLWIFHEFLRFRRKLREYPVKSHKPSRSRRSRSLQSRLMIVSEGQGLSTCLSQE